jgi:hypothetical protein
MAYLRVVMKTLVIHPGNDHSTVFLKPIFEPLTDKTVITGGVTKKQLRLNILTNDRILCLGHGSSSGLFSGGQFPDYYIIDYSMANCLRGKDNIFIWCNADKFVHRNRLHGFYSGMFISEVNEALYYDFPFTDDLEQVIDESNYAFSSIVGRHIDEPLDVLYKWVMKEYGELAETNPIAAFNFNRLYLTQPQPVEYSHKVCQSR